MKLHKNKTLFNQAIRATAQRMDILDIYIEKDYWVCYALYLIYRSQYKNEVIFKGGTALSKCFNSIERFSEDIDLVLLRSREESGNQLKSKLKKVTKTLTEPFKEEVVEGITNKMGMIRKIAFTYPKTCKGAFGQVREHIVLEVSWLGHFEPFSTMQISTYIYDMMIANGQADLAREYDMLPFDAPVLDAKRTFCEKIMSLVRFSYTEDSITDLKNKIRHLYDINKLLQIADVAQFFESDQFSQMLLKVANDDRLSYKNQNNWLEKHPKEAIIFKTPEIVWNQLKGTYNEVFKNLVYGELPQEKQIFETLTKVSNRLAFINWSLKQ